MRAWLAGLAALALSGCVSVSENVSSLNEVGADSVLVVGRIEIVPPVKPEEQKYRAGVDLFNTKRHFIGRAILFMSDKPEVQAFDEEWLSYVGEAVAVVGEVVE